MNLNSLSTQLLYSTVPILVEKQDGSRSSGTGFVFNFPYPEESNSFVPLIVTNRHVVEHTKRGIIQFASQQNGAPIPDSRVRVEFDSTFFFTSNIPNTDIAAAPIAPLLSQLEQRKVGVFFRAVDSSIIPTQVRLEELAAIEDVIFIGYPSGLFDAYNTTPIIRRGITATPVWNNFNNESRFLIDAGVFPGSSGSPVFILNEGGYNTNNGFVIGTRILFLGILSESMLGIGGATEKFFIGLGSVIKSNVVQDYLQTLVSSLVSNTKRPVS